MNSEHTTDKSVAVRHLLKPLQHYMDDPTVTEIIVNGPGKVFVYRGRDRQHVDHPELTHGHLSALFNALTVFNGLGAAPIQSVILPDGQRGQIVQPPAVIDGQLALNIRTPSTTIKSLEQLHQEGAFEGFQDVSINQPEETECQQRLANRAAGLLTASDVELLRLKRAGRITEFLHHCVMNHRNLVIAGKTGSGKTTFARSLIERIPTHERLVTIEDVHELFLPNHQNRIAMMYGSARGRVSATECIKSCMRMSPDRIFLAEIRGSEAWEYLNALNTGHPGSITTTHANSAFDTFDRLGLLVKQSETGQQLDLSTIRGFLQTTVDVVLYFSHYRLSELWFDPIYARSARLGL